MLDLGANSSSFNLLEKDGTTVAAIREYHQDIYFVDTDNVFNRLSLINGAYTLEPLVEGVDDFQLVYGIDRSGDGVANADGGNAAFVELPASASRVGGRGLSKDLPTAQQHQQCPGSQ